MSLKYTSKREFFLLMKLADKSFTTETESLTVTDYFLYNKLIGKSIITKDHSRYTPDLDSYLAKPFSLENILYA